MCEKERDEKEGRWGDEGEGMCEKPIEEGVKGSSGLTRDVR